MRNVLDGTMSNRNILFFSLGVSLAFTLVLSLSFYSAVNPSTVEQQQVDLSRQVVAELRSLQAFTTRQFKEAAERIVLGVKEADELAMALEQSELSFDRLQELNAAEFLALAGSNTHEEEEEEEEELLRMRAIHKRLSEHIK